MKTNILALTLFLSASWPSEAKSAFIPLQLVDFAAHADGGDVKLTWQTNMEQNNRGFNVEYSTDCSNWEQIGFVAGAGNCFSQRQYAFIHSHPSGALHYYRLVQVDYDNGQTYSEVAKIALDNMAVSFEPFPNPATTTLFVPLNSSKDRFSIRVVDITGQPVLFYDQLSGEATFPLNISGLRHGIYFVETDNLTRKTCMEKSKIQKL